MAICCEICGDGHMSDQCSVDPKSVYYVGQQGRGPMNQNNQYGNTYNPNWRNHPNFSWGRNQTTQNQYKPQGNYNQPQKPPQRVEESTNDMLKKLLIDNQQLRIDNQELEEVPKRKKENVTPKGEPIPKTVGETRKETEESKKTLISRPPPHFPQRLKKKNDDRMFKIFLDILSQIQLNLPLVDVLREIPKYAKYIKDIMAKKWLTEFETVALTEECTSRIQRKFPQKLKDPGSFTIHVRIGEVDVGRALCDMGDSINLMPLLVFSQLGL
ncbi:uncharacterized protein [Nicotiana tomentosiformis]|uniref:uncharacterized protein n=1 Tax=Nicotiana tomentosiformis TaxID=4098 RepID=UPI00051B6D2F|nr:uncharacterized protein LOC104106530 [Nicotiana tomentosiformis]